MQEEQRRSFTTEEKTHTNHIPLRGIFWFLVYFGRMPRILHPAPRASWHRRPVSDGARGFVMGIALLLFAVWFLTIGEQARAVHVEMQSLAARVDRFSVRAAALDAELGRRP